MKHIILPLLLTSVLSAQVVEFVPPNDPTGQVWTTNSNDGWAGGRGITLEVGSATTIDSVGLYQDLSGLSISYEVGVFGDSALRSGGATVTTSGLEWIDFDFSGLTLNPGSLYHISFFIVGAANQNFYYNNNNNLWSQDGFSSLDGTYEGSTENSVVAAIRLRIAGDSEPAVPDSASTLWLILVSAPLLIVARRLLRS